MLLLILSKTTKFGDFTKNIVSTISYIMDLAMIHSNLTTIHIVLFFLQSKCTVPSHLITRCSTSLLLDSNLCCLVSNRW